jgi:hypothetical protein
MTSFQTVTLVLVSGWLCVLTLAVLLCIRQIALLGIRLDQSSGAFSFAADGPELGSRISAGAETTLPELARGRVFAVLISATCSPCREFASDLAKHRFDDSVVALLSGPRELADGLEGLLASTGIRVVRDPEAHTVAAALEIQSTPFAVRIEDGTVSAKSYLNRIADLQLLMTDLPLERSPALEVVGSAR